MSVSQEKMAPEANLSLDDLFTAIDAEAARLQELFADADWSGSTYGQFCETVSFEEKGIHWWSRTKIVEYQMMHFLDINESRPCRDKHCYGWHPTSWSDWGYLRSDGKLFFWGARSDYKYVSPRIYLADAAFEEVNGFLDYIRQCMMPSETRISI